MKPQNYKHLKKIEEFSKKTDSLVAEIQMEDVSIKNNIVKLLNDITYTAVSNPIKDNANEQIDGIKAISNVAGRSKKPFAGGVTSTD